MEETLLVQQKGKDQGWHLLHRPMGLVFMVAYKGVWGILELIAGLLLIFSSRLIAAELTEDPQDLFANWLIGRFHFNISGGVWVGVIVSLLGIGKLILAFGLWHQSRLVRNFGVVFFTGLAVFGTYEAISHFSYFKIAALVVDVFILYYFWAVLPKHLRHGEIS